MLYLIISLLFYIPAIRGTRFLINLNYTRFNSPESCPVGYRLAIVDDPKNWEKATRLVLKTFGHNQAVWIRFGLGWRGVGDERWTIVTPKPKGSCKYPPKSLKSFCVPFHKFRLSPVRNFKNYTLPSLCEKLQ